MKKNFYKTIGQGMNIVPQMQRTQLINTNIKQVLGPTKFSNSSTAKNSNYIDMQSKMSKYASMAGGLSSRSSILLPQMQVTALSQARIDRTIKKMTDQGHELSKRNLLNKKPQTFSGRTRNNS